MDADIFDNGDFLSSQEDSNLYKFNEDRVGITVVLVDPITTFYKVSDALNIFKANPELTSIPVEGDKGGVVGLLHHSDLKNQKTSFLNNILEKRVEDFIKPLDNEINAMESIEKVLKELLSGPEHDLFIDLPVSHNGFYGITNFIRLSRQNNKNKNRDMQQARYLQQFLMSKSKLQDVGCKLEVFNKMTHSLGGDFYKIIKMNENLSLIASFDVSGKGISGSLSTIIISSFFTTVEVTGALKDFTPEQIIQLLNATIFDQTPSDVFITAVFLFIERENDQYFVYNCGHTPLWVKDLKDNEITEHQPTMPPLGIMNELDDLENNKTVIPLSRSSQLFIFSDGLTDIRNIRGKEFGEEGLKKFLLENGEQSISELNKNLETVVTDFIGKAPQTDDITLISVQLDTLPNHLKRIGNELLDTVKKLTHIQTSYSTVLSIISHRPGTEKKTWFSKFYSNSEDFIAIIINPLKIAYSGYIYTNGSLYFYNEKKQKIEIKNSDPMFDSDLTADKLFSFTHFQDFQIVDIKDHIINKQTYYLFKLQKGPEIMDLTVKKDTLLPIRKDFFNQDQQCIFTIEYKSWTGVADAYLPSSIVLINRAKKGYRTEIAFSHIKGMKLPDHIFSVEFIEKSRNSQ